MQKEEIIKENYLLIVYKGGHLYTEKYYITLEKVYIIHISRSNMLKL
jgi:hypothetical protein